MFDYPLSYSPFRDGELLFLASRIQNLTEATQDALMSELKRRGLCVPERKQHKPESIGYSAISSRIEISRVKHS